MAYAFTLDVYYKGNNTNELKYGKCYLLDYCSDGDREVIEIFDFENHLTVFKITGNEETKKTQGLLLGHVELEDFIEEGEWERMDTREEKLEKLLNKLDEADIR